MPMQKYSQYYGQELFSDNQRRLGNYLYNSDLDMKLRKYNKINRNPETVAFIDAKYGDSEFIDFGNSSYQSDLFMCQHEFKVPVAHFIAIYYLGSSFTTPMYYIICSNTPATKFNKDFNGGNRKYWFTEMEYSKFQHFMIEKEWNADELRTGEGGKIIEPHFHLSELSNKYIEYEIPEMRGA